jgi:putative membrane protein (TIGR04086 family)
MMFENIRFSALCIGALFGYVVPIAASLWVITSLLGATHARDALGDTAYPAMLMVIHIGGPLLGGFLAARSGKSRPLVHGVITALMGWLVAAMFGSGVLIGIVYVLASVTGAAIWRGRSA